MLKKSSPVLRGNRYLTSQPASHPPTQVAIYPCHSHVHFSSKYLLNTLLCTRGYASVRYTIINILRHHGFLGGKDWYVKVTQSDKCNIRHIQYREVVK